MNFETEFRTDPEGNSKRKMPCTLIRPGVLAFTFNPGEQCICPPKVSLGDHDRMGKWKAYVTKTLNQILKTTNIYYYLEIEISEKPCMGNRPPGSQVPRLHGHGLLYIGDNDNLRDFFLYVCPFLDQVSIYEVDTISDPDYWIEYCTKHNWLIDDVITNVPWYSRRSGMRDIYDSLIALIENPGVLNPVSPPAKKGVDEPIEKPPARYPADKRLRRRRRK